uniref:Uncharacterized protein n=1 Tax=Nelumbo nucifera TaxID=4432 RepID=A0A822ZA70_NELNU|nr:TPA_asm: hypothetical protein HUJ06_015786 [Nelumbo nucifera]
MGRQPAGFPTLQGWPKLHSGWTKDKGPWTLRLRATGLSSLIVDLSPHRPIKHHITDGIASDRGRALVTGHSSSIELKISFAQSPVHRCSSSSNPWASTVQHHQLCAATHDCRWEPIAFTPPGIHACRRLIPLFSR